MLRCHWGSLLGIIHGDHLQVTTQILPGLAAHGICRVDVRNLGDIIQTCDVASLKDMQALVTNQKLLSITRHEWYEKAVTSWPNADCGESDSDWAHSSLGVPDRGHSDAAHSGHR